MKKGGAKKAREAVLRINSYLSEMETFQSEMAIWEARRKEALAAIREWTETFAPVIRGAGGEPALYMVWPSRSRLFAFDEVRTSYLNAAEAVGGRFLPAGEAWREVWEDDPDADLLGADGAHPTTLVSFVAALTIYAELFEEDVTVLPAELTPSSTGLQSISLPEETAVLIYAAVQRGVTKW